MNKDKLKKYEKIDNKIGKYCEKIDKINQKIWILQEKVKEIFDEEKKS